MGSKKKAKKTELKEEEDGAANASTSLVVTRSSDDNEEANEDLSLKMVQKALLTRATNPQNDAVFDGPNSEEVNTQKKKRRKKKKLESGTQSVNVSPMLYLFSSKLILEKMIFSLSIFSWKIGLSELLVVFMENWAYLVCNTRRV